MKDSVTISLINKFVQFVIPEKYFKDWIYTFYPMMNWNKNETIEEIIKIISPYWDSICLSYSDPPLDESFEKKYGRLDKGIQIYRRFGHI